MESTLSALLAPLFPALDEPLLAYLAGVACEGKPPAASKWRSGADAFNVLTELLDSYEAVESEVEAKTKCDQLFANMVEKGLIKGMTAVPAAAPAAAAAPSAAATAAAAAKSAAATATAASAANGTAKPASATANGAAKPAAAASSSASSSAAAPSPAALPAPGSTCLARFSGDGQFYRAEVVSVKSIPVVRILVKFVEYGDKEEVALSAIKDVGPPAPRVSKSGRPVLQDGSDDDGSSDDSDTDSEDESAANSGKTKPAGAAKLLGNPVRIGELGPSRAAARAAEQAAALAAAEASASSGRELTHREQKALRKRLLKAERAERDAVAKTTWNPHVHKTAVQNAALPLYLQSQHLAKKAGTKDIALEDLSLLAPDNTELLSNTELKLVYGRRYGLIGRNGIGKSTLLRAMSTYQIPKFPTWIKIMHVEQECIAERASVLDVVINADLERSMLVKEEEALNAKLKEIENAMAAAPSAAAAADAALAPADAAAAEAAPVEPPSPTASLASAVSNASIATTAASVSSSSSGAAAPASSSSSSRARTAGSSSATLSDPAAISDRLTAIYERLGEIDSHTAHARASTILSGLQFSTEMQAMPTAALSGGWRMRVALACALFVSPDLLLLDEPTNHLDFPAVLWLQSYLQSYEKTVLIVSHDRTFLNEVITDVVYFTNKKRLESYRGDYSSFVHVREEKYKNDRRAYESQQMYRQHLQDFITTFKTEKKNAAQDRKVGQAMSKQKILDKMEMLENPDEESTDRFSLRFPEPGLLRLPLIADIKNVNFKYPRRVIAAPDEANPTDEEKKAAAAAGSAAATPVPAQSPITLPDNGQLLLENITVRVEITSRIGILGANGSGKSTLIKVLLGDLQPVDGLVWLNSNVRIAYFTQHHVDQMNLGLTAVQWLRHVFPGTPDVDCRRHLGKFGLMGELALMQIGNLSGGQKSRLAFAIICWKEPHMLILDEPTNHLDMETIDVLIKAVNEFKGAVIIISHDQHFLQGTVKEFWSISDRKLKTFDTLDACKRATYKLQEH